MNQSSKYDSKWLSLGILISLGAAGIGFVLGHYALPYMLYTDLSCSTLTNDDWVKSPYHNQFNTLEAFIKSCNFSQSNIDFDVKVMPGIILPIVGFGLFFVSWIQNGWHLKENKKQ